MFFAAMYSAAFLETDPRRIVELGRQAIPEESGYGQIIDDDLRWQEEEHADWRATWQKIESKWNHDLCPWGIPALLVVITVLALLWLTQVVSQAHRFPSRWLRRRVAYPSSTKCIRPDDKILEGAHQSGQRLDP